MKVIPGILIKTKEELVKDLSLLEGIADEIQIDICDGVYVKSKTWPYSLYDSTDSMLRDNDAVSDSVASLEESCGNIAVELDLMVSEPELLFSLWDDFHPERVLVHLDSIKDEEALAITLSSLKSRFSWVVDHNLGFAVSQNTNLSKLDNWYFSFDLKFIQVMGIDPIGIQGAKFNEKTFEIIEDLKEKFPGVSIQVDGGVTEELLLPLKKAGVTSVIMGSAIFAQGNPAENLKRFQDMVQ